MMFSITRILIASVSFSLLRNKRQSSIEVAPIVHLVLPSTTIYAAKLMILLWIVVRPVLATDQSIHYCPVSKALDLNGSDHYVFYPVDIFAPPEKLREETRLSTNCSAIDKTCGPRDEDSLSYAMCNHRCSTTKDFCPVHKMNIIETIPQNASHLAKTALCALKDKLMNASEVINVYISGGSVTAGAFTHGCCSAPECFAARDRTLCCWSFQFTRWMNSTFPANVVYHTLAMAGRDTEGAVTFFRQQWLNKPKFTSNDIFLLDHSVNDNAACARGVPYTEIAALVEELIRLLYSYSEPYSLPTIILLDADPKHHSENPNPAYAAGYNLAAKHYDIPVWSYREASISVYPIQHQRNFYQYLNFDMSRGTHPGWPIHLLIADLYAAILQHDLKNTCTDGNVELQLAFRNRTMKDLPAPRSKDQFVCNKKVLSMSYEMITKKEEVIGTYHTVPNGSWELREDIVGRVGTAGFIRQLNSSATIEHDNNAKLVFTLNITTKEILEKRINVSLQIYFGRSYDNGGLAQLSFCGKNVSDEPYPVFPGGLMNGLWGIKYYPFSLPFKWAPRPLAYTYCEGFAGRHPTVEVTHKMIDPKLSPPEKQKFKVQDILVCA